MPSRFQVLPDGTQITLVHFSFPDEYGIERVSCAPHEDLRSHQPFCIHPWHRSDDARAVNCKFCKESAIFQAAAALLAERLRDAPGAVVHWSCVNERGGEVLACRPDADLRARQPLSTLPWLRSPDVRAVTCPQCMAKEAYKFLCDEQKKQLPTTVSSIHFSYDDDGLERIACDPLSDPNMRVGFHPRSRSNDFRAVTCLQCRETEVMQKAALAYREARKKAALAYRGARKKK